MEIIPHFVQENVPLVQANTLALPGAARYFVEFGDIKQLAPQLSELKQWSCWSTLPHFVLGGGSNLVLLGDFNGIVIRPNLKGRQLVSENDEAWLVSAAAGESWHDFVQWTLAQGWPGLENLSLIPGTVGAAPVQNIGAYGLEVADVFDHLCGIDLATGQTQVFDASDCSFSYRNSIFKQQGWHLSGRFLIMEVTFRLPKRWLPRLAYGDIRQQLVRANQLSANEIPYSAQAVADAVISIRQSKLPDPTLLPNAGSFFQNPVVTAELADELCAKHPGMPHYLQADGQSKLAAGWLIEHSGWKGVRLGPVGMYEKQALILVNYGGATACDIQALCQAVQQSVQEKFGVWLVPEPIFFSSNAQILKESACLI